MEYPRADKAVIVDAESGERTEIESGETANALYYEMMDMEQAVRSVHPWAVDLSSSLEINGKKDGDRIQEAVSIVRRIS